MTTALRNDSGSMGEGTSEGLRSARQSGQPTGRGPYSRAIDSIEDAGSLAPACDKSGLPQRAQMLRKRGAVQSNGLDHLHRIQLSLGEQVHDFLPPRMCEGPEDVLCSKW